MKSHLRPIGQTDTWITPKYITEALGTFDLDPCAHTDMPWQHAKKVFTIKENGLIQKWKGRVWLNPPFNQYMIQRWMERMMGHKNGVVLLNAAAETVRFYNYVYPKATGILMMEKRPSFYKPDGTLAGNSGQTICLISYDEQNLKALINSKLGVVLEVNKQSLKYLKQ